MKKFKHSKYKNTGIIFELLSKQVAMDVLTGNKNVSLDIIKQFFKEGTELHRELACYQALIDTKGKREAVAHKLLDIVLEQRSAIDNKKLNREKYNLIGEIKKNYIADTFFDSRVSDYKLYASIYKLFEFNSADNPVGHIDCYDTILEHMTVTKPVTQKVTPKTLFNEQSDDVKKLALKMIIEKFNEKYKNLNPRQIKLVSRFINENTELEPFKNYVYSEVNYIQSSLMRLRENISDPVLKIKLREVTNLTTEITSARRIKDEHVSAMVKYYALIDYLEKQ